MQNMPQSSMVASASEIFLVLCLYVTATFLPRRLPRRYYPSYKLVHHSFQIFMLINILLTMGVFPSIGLSLAVQNQLHRSAKISMYAILCFYIGWTLGYAAGIWFFDKRVEGDLREAFALLKSLQREISPAKHVDRRAARHSRWEYILSRSCEFRLWEATCGDRRVNSREEQQSPRKARLRNY